VTLRRKARRSGNLLVVVNYNYITIRNVITYPSRMSVYINNVGAFRKMVAIFLFNYYVQYSGMLYAI
jgi:hypothetical protein